MSYTKNMKSLLLLKLKKEKKVRLLNGKRVAPNPLINMDLLQNLQREATKRLLGENQPQSSLLRIEEKKAGT